MSDEYGWGREVFALAAALSNLFWGLSQPIAGAIADRFGTAKVLATGGLIYALGLYLMSQSGEPLLLHVSLGFLIGVALGGASFAVVLAAFTRIVPEEKRSWALGLGTAAGSLGQFLMVPLGQAFISAYGWSVALMILIFFALAIVPLSRVFAHIPVAAQQTEQTLKEAIREAGGHGSYWLLIAGFFVCGFHVAFISVHLPSYVVDKGLDPSLGAWALSLVGIFNVIGAYSSGVLGGRYSKKYLLSMLYFTRSIVIALFLLTPITTVTVLVFASVMGLLWLSTVPLTSGLVAVMFGQRYVATLFGVVFFSHQIGSFLGVWLGGYFFDTTGSYNQIWWWGVALGIISALLHWPIKEQSVESLAAARA